LPPVGTQTPFSGWSVPTFVNYELARLGYVYVYSLPPDTACDGMLLTAQRAAVSGETGAWLPPGTPTRTPQVIMAWQLTATALCAKHAARCATSYPTPTAEICHPAYPYVCIAPRPPELDCKDIPFRNFTAWPPDPHNFDRNHNGIGCDREDRLLETCIYRSELYHYGDVCPKR
jgi:micrococcal nuclease